MEEDKLPKKKRRHVLLKIILVLSALALLLALAVFVPAWKPYRTAGYNAMAKANLMEFHAASQNYFVKNPSGIIDIDTAKKYGYKPTYSVTIIVLQGDSKKFKVTAAHENGTKTYTVDKAGNIEEKKNQ